jgi:hypothetical protein
MESTFEESCYLSTKVKFERASIVEEYQIFRTSISSPMMILRVFS